MSRNVQSYELNLFLSSLACEFSQGSRVLLGRCGWVLGVWSCRQDLVPCHFALTLELIPCSVSWPPWTQQLCSDTLFIHDVPTWKLLTVIWISFKHEPNWTSSLNCQCWLFVSAKRKQTVVVVVTITDNLLRSDWNLLVGGVRRCLRKQTGETLESCKQRLIGGSAQSSWDQNINRMQPIKLQSGCFS